MTKTLIALALIWLSTTVSVPALADIPGTSDTTEVHAVMFELEYDTSGSIRHAQAIGGYPSMDSCQAAMPKLMGFIGTLIEKGLQAQLLCSGVRLAPPKDGATHATPDTIL